MRVQLNQLLIRYQAVVGLRIQEAEECEETVYLGSD